METNFIVCHINEICKHHDEFYKIFGFSVYLVSVLARVEPSDWETITEWFSKSEIRTISTLETVFHGVELQCSSQGEGHGHLRGGDEAVGGGVSIVTTSEVSKICQSDSGYHQPIKTSLCYYFLLEKL